MEAATAHAPASARQRLNEAIDWTPVAIATLEQLWEEGLPTKDIAAELGNPEGRNAVIGKARRLGLPPRKPGMPPRKGAPALASARAASLPKPSTAPPPPRQKPTPQIATPRFQLVCEVAPSGGVEIIDLRDNHCRWPVAPGDGELMRYCGAARVQREVSGMLCSYCAEHAHLAYDRPPRSVRQLEADERRRQFQMKSRRAA